jgi:hypothetical protein
VAREPSWDQGHELVNPALHVRLLHANLNPFVEHLEHRERIRHTSADADDRDGASSSHAVDGSIERSETIVAGRQEPGSDD